MLAQPTRARLFALLQQERRPLSSAELAGRLGLHVNGVRRHLAQLEGAGFLERRKQPGARGRPADQWSVAAGPYPGGQRPQAYGDLARWLTRVLEKGRPSRSQVERTGSEIGHELAPRGVDQPAETFRATLSALGFQPELEISGGTVDCRLCNCPYRDSVVESPEVVCTLHRGITEGLLEVLAPEGSLESFVPHDPDEAGCEVVIEGVDWPFAAAVSS